MTVIVPPRFLRLARIAGAFLEGHVTGGEYRDLFNLEVALLRLEEVHVTARAGTTTRELIFGPDWHLRIERRSNGSTDEA